MITKISTRITVIGYCLLAIGLVSCNEDPEYFQLKTYPDQMHISVSQEEIVFNKGIANQPALTFDWQKAVSPLLEVP